MLPWMNSDMLKLMRKSPTDEKRPLELILAHCSDAFNEHRP